MARDDGGERDAGKNGKTTRRRSKAAAGAGTLRQRPNGLWEARIRLPDGRRKSLYAATQGEARRLLSQATHDRDRGLPIIGDERQTLGAYLHAWVKRKRANLAPSTARRYDELLRYVTRAYGDMRLTALTPTHLVTLYQRLQEAAPAGNGLSSSTVKRIHAALHAALHDAVTLGVVASNITERVPDPPQNRRYTVEPLTAEEAQRVLEAARGDRLEALYVLALATGARIGELLGLTWQAAQLDAERPHINIVASLRAAAPPESQDGTTSDQPIQPIQPIQPRRRAKPGASQRWELGATKTSGSRRVVNLPSIAVEALRAHRKRQLAERLQAGPLWVERDLVFCDATGGYLDKSGIPRYHLYPLLDRAGVRRVRFHDLRHTAATLLLEAGIGLKAVSGQLGHASVNTTGNIYGHQTAAMRAEVADTLGAILSKTSKTSKKRSDPSGDGR